MTSWADPEIVETYATALMEQGVDTSFAERLIKQAHRLHLRAVQEGYARQAEADRRARLAAATRDGANAAARSVMRSIGIELEDDDLEPEPIPTLWQADGQPIPPTPMELNRLRYGPWE